MNRVVDFTPPHALPEGAHDPFTPIGAALRGSLTLVDHFRTASDLWDGSGEREVRREVAFPRAFLNPPMVFVSMSLLDAAREQNLRYALSAEEVTEHGFILRLRTWNDTRIARAGVEWMALG